LNVEYEKLNYAHKKKSEHKALQKKFEKSLEEEEILKRKVSMLEDGRMYLLSVNVASCMN